MRVSISNKIGIFVAATLSILLSIMMTMILSRTTAQQMHEMMQSVSDMKEVLHRSAVFAMGQGVTDLSTYKEMIEDLPSISEVRIFPTDLIEEGSEQKLDEKERQSLQTKESKVLDETFKGERVIRVIEPILADESCLECHEGKKKDALAVISIRYIAENNLNMISGQRWLSFFLTLATIGLTFLVIMYLINRNVLADLKKFIETIKQLALGDVNFSIESKRNDELGDAFKSLKELQENVKQKTAMAVEISEGRLENDVKVASDRDELGKAMVTMQDSIRLLMEDVGILIASASEGQLNVRADGDGHQGGYQRIILGINEILDAIVDPLKVSEDILQKIAAGEIPERITRTFKGDYQVLMDNLNICINSINHLKADTEMLVTAAIAGDLEVRADTARHQGDYRKIVEGINNTLDALLEPINEIQQVLEELEKGNLTVAVTGHYNGEYARLKENLNKTVNALHDMVRQVSVSVNQVSTGAQQVSDSSQAVSQGATEQASSLEEITASMTEIGSQSRQNSENAAQANQVAAASRQAAEEGSTQVNQMLTAMAEINDSAGKISKIIKVIDEIAFQTNLLALNAAVEAARAGVHGKGFAVVAEEVRNLAQRSAKAAEETTVLIQNSVEKAEKGSGIANQSAQALFKIIEGISKVSDLIGEITSASQEQVQGLDQVAQGLGQIDQVTQTNTANAEESASVAEELSGQAAHLKKMIGRFRVKGRTSKEMAVYQAEPVSTFDIPEIDESETDSFEAGRELEVPEQIILDDDEFGKF